MLKLPGLVPICNITPDSFSDGGRWSTLAALTEEVNKWLADGDIAAIDVGAESTRLGATPLSWQEEWERLQWALPTLINILKNTGVAISLDTYHPETAKRALDLGIQWINDVKGGDDEAMWPLIKSYPEVRYVVMHHLGVPVQAGQTLPAGEDPVLTINQWAHSRLQKAAGYGISETQLILDPGIGYGKTPLHSWHVLKQLERLETGNSQLLIGHSRKKFLTLVTDALAPERDIETVVVSSLLSTSKVDYLRIHNPTWHQRAWNVLKHWDNLPC
jgi:dihydropteroate synthase